MANTIKLSDLHGTSVESQHSVDQGFGDQTKLLDTEDDDVFLEDSLPFGSGRTLPSLTETRKLSFAKRTSDDSHLRKTTVRTSGYGSDVTLSISSTDRHILDVTIEEPRCNQQTSSKERRDVSSQTDFPEEEIELEKIADAALVEMSSRKEQDFCWRHDDIYDKVGDSPRRLMISSAVNACQVDGKKEDSAGNISRLNFSNEACQTCKVESAKKRDLDSRKEKIRLPKGIVHPTVAKVKSCPINLLQTQISPCSDLWTENRTFYLGPEKVVPLIKSTRQRTMSLPSLRSSKLMGQLNSWSCLQCNEDASDEDRPCKQHACSRHRFWIPSLSRGKMMAAKEKNKTEKKSNRRDWILVQCVTKYGPDMDTRLEAGERLNYHEYGKREVILCPVEMKSITYIEEVCCQHFIHMSREEALESERKIELLFSSMGPMVRDDKHLLGRSVFYFCCDFPFDVNRRKQSAQNGVSQKEDILPISWEYGENGNQPQSSNLDALLLGERRRTVNSLKSKKTAPMEKNKKRKSSKKSTSKGRKAFSTETTKLEGDCDNKNFEEVFDEADKMRKSVTFADEVQEEIFDDNDETKAQQLLEMLNKRRGSVPPPPPKFLENQKAFEKARRKRRESIQLSIASAPERRKKEIPETIQKKPISFKAYQAPEFQSINIVVSFKGEKYSNTFLEYETLEDVYSWVRKQLLKNNVFTPGADLLLSYDNLKFPLKASTANKAISTLPHFNLLCEELSHIDRGGSFGDTNSRYDTRFALPLDIKSLEGMDPGQYLSKYCIVSSTWKAFYHNTFLEHDKDRDGLMSYKELKRAMERLFVELSHPLLKRVLFLLGYDPTSKLSSCDDFNKDKTLNWRFEPDTEDTKTLKKWQENLTIDKPIFIGICALANRIICREDKIDGYVVDNVKQAGTQLEDADFYNIEGKLRDYALKPLTKVLLMYLKK